MNEKTKIYFLPIEEPRLDFVSKAVQKGMKFLDEFCRDSDDAKAVILYAWSKQDVPNYFRESFNQDAIKILTEGKTLRGSNSTIKLVSHETFSPSSDNKIIFSAYPNKKMLDDISDAINGDTVEAVIIVNDEKKSESWLTKWAPNLQKVD